MKCFNCDGRGAVQIAPNVKGLKKCPVCGGSGEVSQIEQTNEEWFCGLSTEEKAKALGKVAYTVMTYNEALRWLKEKHDG